MCFYILRGKLGNKSPLFLVLPIFCFCNNRLKGGQDIWIHKRLLFITNHFEKRIQNESREALCTIKTMFRIDYRRDKGIFYIIERKPYAQLFILRKRLLQVILKTIPCMSLCIMSPHRERGRRLRKTSDIS